MASLFRVASRLAIQSSRPRSALPVRQMQKAVAPCGLRQERMFGSSRALRSSEHEDETFEEFTTRVENEFNAVNDVFELQRNLNNAFAYDLVPAPSVLVAALKAARRVNDFPTAVRVFEGLKHKVENETQYEEYLKELEPIRSELGVSLQEHMYPTK